MRMLFRGRTDGFEKLHVPGLRPNGGLDDSVRICNRAREPGAPHSARTGKPQADAQGPARQVMLSAALGSPTTFTTTEVMSSWVSSVSQKTRAAWWTASTMRLAGAFR